MNNKNTGLGKGLDALFGNIEIPKDEERKVGEAVEHIAITSIEPNKEQARKRFDKEKLEELSNSIKEYGVIQPIIVTKKDDYYMIIAGERRWRAAKMAGLKEMPCLVRNVEEEQKNMEISLIENIQRENLNPIERAQGLKRILDTYGMSQQALADKLGVSRSGLTNSLRVLNLDPRVIELVIDNNLSERHCRALLTIQDGDKQLKMAQKIIENKDSIAETERKIGNIKNNKEDENKRKYKAIFDDIENSFQSFFGTKVKLEAGKRKGKIVIEYSSNDDLERILNLIK